MFKGSIRAIITGIAATAVLLAVLAASRLFDTQVEQDETEMIEIATIIPAPEEPPLDEPEEELEELDEPLLAEEITTPTASLDLMDAALLETPALPASDLNFSPVMNVDVMQVDRAPAELAVKKVARPISKPTRVKPSKPASKVRTTKPKKTKKPRPTQVKSHYSPSELDGRPRELRQGTFTWPPRAKGRSGTVSLSIELSTSGRVTVLGVLSSSDPALISSAKKLARSSRYTAPRRNGKLVKARFSKTYKLIKPR